MALNDIIVPRQNAQGLFDERVLTAADISAAAATHASTHHTGGSDPLTPANIGAAQAVTVIQLASDETNTITTAELPARGIATSDSDAQTFVINLPTPSAQQSGLTFSIKRVEGVQEAAETFFTVNHASVAVLNFGELDSGEGSIDFLWDGHAWSYSGSYNLRSFPGRVLALPIASGTLALTQSQDDVFRIIGSSDATKKVAFEVDTLVSAGTTRTLTVPNSSGTIALTSQLATGSTDNAILRADDTGGAQTQASDLVIDDAVVAFSITGDAGTDIITAVGHNYTANQGVRFPTLTGGSGLTAASTNYFVRDISGNTFRVSTTSGGSAVNFTTNITAGTVIAVQANVTIRNNSSETNSALVLSPKGTGAFILGPKPDGTTTVGGNPRGAGAVDLSLSRRADSRVASGQYSFCAGENVLASGFHSVCFSQDGTASGSYSFAVGYASIASGQDTGCIGRNCEATAEYAFAQGRASKADRWGMLSSAAQRFAAAGDCQYANLKASIKTTNASATELRLDGSSTRITIPSGKICCYLVQIVGIKSDGSSVAEYWRRVRIKNVEGTTALVGTIETIGTDHEDNASTDVAITADDTNNALAISVTGIASETWRWLAVLTGGEVAYGT